MPKYEYQPFSNKGSTIRVLQLDPAKECTARPRCKLIEYVFDKDDRTNHMYEALSYVWGGDAKPQSITLADDDEKGQGTDYEFPITQSLHDALLRLRHNRFPRYLWVDAVCINQMDDAEKEFQIGLMPVIYARARCVVIWLGNEADGSSEALEYIRAASVQRDETSRQRDSSRLQKSTSLEVLAGNDAIAPAYEPIMTSSKKPDEESLKGQQLPSDESKFGSGDKKVQQAVACLLQRPWFGRMWILQEAAGARHITLLCGTAEIDGHAFCLGLDELNTFCRIPYCAVSFLMRGAVLRQKRVTVQSSKFSLGICSLSELVDQYHGQMATNRHDKIYALLGMSTKDHSDAGLEPNYKLPWGVLMERLVKCLLGNDVTVSACDDAEVAVIRTKGYVLGRVTSVTTTQDWKMRVEFIDCRTANTSLPGDNHGFEVSFPRPSKRVKIGDLLCCLHGSHKKVILRPNNEYLDVIMIGLEINRSTYFPVCTKSCTRDFVLVWNWIVDSTETAKLQVRKMVQNTDTTRLDDYIKTLVRSWNIALILGDSQLRDQAKHILQNLIRESIAFYGLAKDDVAEQWHSGPSLMAFAARSGLVDLTSVLLTAMATDPDLKDWNGRTPLTVAAAYGHVDVVDVLLTSDQVYINSQDVDGWTALLCATVGGHRETVERLLKCPNLDVNLRELKHGRTALFCAAENGADDILDLLLHQNAIIIDATNDEGHTPLIAGARGGHIGVVRRLLANGDTQAISGDTTKGRTALSWACRNGHTEIAEMLLAAVKFDVDSLDIESGRTALMWAAEAGHANLVRVILRAVSVDLRTKDTKQGRTSCSLAAEKGHLEVVRIFLDNGYVDDAGVADIEYGRTALAWAAGDGHTDVVKLLLYHSHGRSLRLALDFHGQTALFWAAADGHESAVRALLAYDESDVGLVSKYGWTPLMWAASGGHVPVVKALLQVARLDVNVKESKLGRTALSWAAAHGHAEVVSLLLENNDIDIDLPDDEGFTPLFCAVSHDHEVVVSLLLNTRVQVDMVDTSGRSPLILASELGYSGVVRLLLEVGHADVHAKDQRDQTALSLAVANGHDDVARVLIEIGGAEAFYPGNLSKSTSTRNRES